MPIVNGPIVDHGAILEVVLGVSQSRRRLLEKHGFAVPQPVPVRVLIDTGANVSGFAEHVFQSLDVQPFWKTTVLTPSTPIHAPYECNLYHVSFSILANGTAHDLQDCKVISTENFHPSEGIQGVIGRDLLVHCIFIYLGTERKFTLAF